MSYSMWRQLTDDPDGRLNTLRSYAQEVFSDDNAARRWLGSINLAVGRGDAPATACATAHGFFEGMAELARLERFQRREAAKRLRMGAVPAQVSAVG